MASLDTEQLGASTAQSEQPVIIEAGGQVEAAGINFLNAVIRHEREVAYERHTESLGARILLSLGIRKRGTEWSDMHEAGEELKTAIRNEVELSVADERNVGR